MPKIDFESTNFTNFEEVVHYFGRSDDEMISEKMLILKICRGSGLMPNLIKKILDGIWHVVNTKSL